MTKLEVDQDNSTIQHNTNLIHPINQYNVDSRFIFLYKAKIAKYINYYILI